MIATDARARDLLIETGTPPEAATALIDLISVGRDQALAEMEAMLAKIEAAAAQVVALADERDSLAAARENLATRITALEAQLAAATEQAEGFASRLYACRDCLASIVDLVMPEVVGWQHAELIDGVSRLVAERDRHAADLATLRRLVDDGRQRLGADSTESLGAAADRVVERAAGLLLQVSGKQERIDELLALVAKLSRETPYADEVKGWTEQRAKMVAEIGTLKAERAAWARDVLLRDGENHATTARITALKDALREAAGCVADTVQCETQHGNHEDDPDWKQAMTWFALANGAP